MRPRAYETEVADDLGIEGPRVAFKGGLHHAVALDLVLSGVETAHTVAPAAVRLARETLAVKLETVRLLAVAAHLPCHKLPFREYHSSPTEALTDRLG